MMSSPPTRPDDLPDPAPVRSTYGWLVWRVTLYVLGFIILLALVAAQWLHKFRVDLLAGLLAGVGAAVAIGVVARRRPRWLEGPSRKAWLAGVLSLALLVRLATLLIPYQPVNDWQVYHQSAVALARTGSFFATGQAGCEGNYRCLLPPAQIALLAGLYRLFGPHVWIGQLFNALLGCGVVAGIWYVAGRVGGRRVARAASLGVALLPSSVLGVMLQGAEVPQTFWMLVALGVYLAWVDRRLHWWAPGLCGVCWGVAALIRPTFVLMPAVFALHMLLAWRRPRRALLAGALMALGTAIVVLPWTARNYAATGGFILISSNSGVNLYSANNPDARGDYTPAAAQYVYGHARNDVELQRIGRTRAAEWIRKHPRRFAELMIWKFAIFWWWDKDIAWWTLTHPVDGMLEGAGPSETVPTEGMMRVRRWGPAVEAMASGYYLAVLIAAWAGVWLWRRRLQTDRTWLIIPLLCGYFTAVHMVFEAQAKYHYSLVGLLVILAALSTRPAPSGIVSGPSRPVEESPATEA